MDKEESPLDVLSRAATMVSPPSYDEARTYSSKELPSVKWRKERRGHQNIHSHSRPLTDAPLDFSNSNGVPSSLVAARAPPSYDQSMRYKNISRPSVIQSVAPQRTPPPPSPSPSPPLEDVCDPAIDEHFRRSLGKDYSSIFSPVKTVTQTKAPESDPTGLSVDDHFAKALGETWTKLKEQENKSKHVTTSSDPAAVAVGHNKKKNKDSGGLNDKRRAVVTTT